MNGTSRYREAANRRCFITILHWNQDSAMRVDLHCHSTASDGVLAPAALVQRAHEKGVGLLALTDHDTPGRPAGSPPGGRSTRYRTGQRRRAVLHLGWRHHPCAGLRFRPRRRSLRQATEALHRGRWARAEKSTDGWRPGYARGAGGRAGDPAALGDSGNAPARPHFAEFLVQGGWVKDRADAFRKWLGPASWETSSSTGRPWRKWSAACARRAPGSAWRTRTI